VTKQPKRRKSLDESQSAVLLFQNGFSRSMISAMLGETYLRISRVLNKAGYRCDRSQKTKTRTYRSWHSMVMRCTNPNAAYYSQYGHKGIRICTRWFNFANFLADMGERPEGKTLDRINNNGNYEPGNCRWATPLEQASNRSCYRPITYAGESLSMEGWDRRMGLTIGTVGERIKRGWSVDRAISTALMLKYSNKKSEHA
jgi:hypothetical protein